MMRVFISSTSEDLVQYRAVVIDAVQHTGWQAIGMESFGTDTRPTVDACIGRVLECDLFVLILAFRYGWIPKPEEGGDGASSITRLEYDAAVKARKPIRILMANDDWPGRLWDSDSDLRGAILDFRRTVNRPAVFFPFEEFNPAATERMPRFRTTIRQELLRHKETLLDGGHEKKPVSTRPASERVIRAPDYSVSLPERPYPLLSSYTHPDLLGGRDREINSLTRKLGGARPVVGVYAASGIGKSSLLRAGLMPRLAEEKRPCALISHPAEPLLGPRIVLQLFEDYEMGDKELSPTQFANEIIACRRAVGGPPVIIIDQFEDLFRIDASRAGLARLGPLISATVQLTPEVHGPLCYWVLSYRQEFHGEVSEWLSDALKEARRQNIAGIESLPHALNGPDRFIGFSVPPLGAGDPGEEETRAPEAAFLDSILRPLRLKFSDGKARYPWTMSDDSASRLAAAFGHARAAQPEAPLVPELQVVLARLLETAERKDGALVMEAPSDLDTLIHSALRDHVVKSIREIFPAAQTGNAPTKRASALIALRRLSDTEALSSRGLPAQDLFAMMPDEDPDIFARLASEQARLITARQVDGELFYELSHDSVGKIVLDLTYRDIATPLRDFDSDLIELSGYVGRRALMYQETQDPSTTHVDRRRYGRIAENEAALIWSAPRRAWWLAAQETRRRELNRILMIGGAAAAIVLAFGGAAFLGSSRLERMYVRGQVTQQLRTSDDPATVIAGMQRLRGDFGLDDEGAAEALGNLDDARLIALLFEDPSEAVSESVRSHARLQIAAAALDRASSLGAVGAIAATADEVGHFTPNFANQAAALRARAVARARELFGEPDLDRFGWVSIPGGRFRMGCDWRIERQCFDDENPTHRVDLAPFQIMNHEVTLAEYRLVDAAHVQLDVRDDPNSRRARRQAQNQPATGVTWYEAYGFATWLGGRLPREAEWEFAARAGATGAFSNGDDRAAAERVGWFDSNSNTENDGIRAHPVMSKPPNGFGLYDMHGNVREWVTDWYAPYADDNVVDPAGGPRGMLRVVRSGSYMLGAHWGRSASRFRFSPTGTYVHLGFRVARSNDE